MATLAIRRVAIPRIPPRVSHDLALAAAGALLLFIGVQLWVAAMSPVSILYHNQGADYSVYMAATRRFLAGGDFYRPFDVLYPPIALLVFVPFSLLPPQAWWIVSLGTIGYVAYHQTRTDWQRVALLASLATGGSMIGILTGNGSLMVATAIAAGNRWGWPAALVVLKPNLAPWSLVGVRSRGWWITLGVLALASFALLPLWFEWARAMLGFYGSSVWQTGGPAVASGPSFLTSSLSIEFVLVWFATRRQDFAIP